MVVPFSNGISQPSCTQVETGGVFAGHKWDRSSKALKDDIFSSLSDPSAGNWVFPGGSDGKESACNAGDPG